MTSAQEGTEQAPEHPGGRTGRRPGAPGTRVEILSAATELFGRDGYSATSMRAVARAAGVDAALVVHYFDSKPGLLRAVLERHLDPDDEDVAELLAGPPQTVGEGLVRCLVERWDGEDPEAITTLMTCSLRDPVAGELLQEAVKQRITGPVAGALARDGSGAQTDLRADLAAAQIIGLAIARQSLRLPSLVERDAGALAAVFGPILQQTLTGSVAHR